MTKLVNSNVLSQIGKFASLFAFTLGLTMFAQSQISRQAIVEPTSAEQAAMRLQDKLLGVIRNASGDPEHQHIHLVIGFSTGHFSKDPLAAEASRIIAWNLVQDTLIQDDKVSCYAWEMQIWDHPGSIKNPLTVRSDMKEGKSAIKDLFPLTTQQGSRGGHDTEQAIVEITKRLPSESDAVIVLLTNTAASISIPGRKVIGADHPDYLSVLTRWLRLPSLNKSGASLELPYTITDSSGRSIKRTLDAVVLIPKRFQGASLISGTRTERLSNRVILHSETSPKKDRNIVPFLTVLAILLVIAIVGYGFVKILSGSLRGWILEVNGQKFEPNGVRNGEQICELVGVEYERKREASVILTEIPPLRAAILIRSGDRVLIKNDKMKVSTINGVFSSEPLLKRGGCYRVILQGKDESKPGLPPKEFKTEIEIKFNRV